VVAKLDAKDNIYPNKERPENKIDGMVGLIMALSRAMLQSDALDSLSKHIENSRNQDALMGIIARMFGRKSSEIIDTPDKLSAYLSIRCAVLYGQERNNTKRHAVKHGVRMC